ncbi:hypothetical protein Dimus_029162 [Dionaea muscipula]
MRHRSSPSAMPLSSPDPAEVSSSEEEEATVVAVSTSEEEDHADLEGRLLVSLNFFKSLSIPEQSDSVVGSTSAASSDSSTISPTTVVLLCQDAIAAGGPVGGGLKLTRADSVSSVSSPFVGCHSVSDGLQQLVIVEDGGHLLNCSRIRVDDEQQVVAGYLQLRDFMVSQSSFSLCDVVAGGVVREEVPPVIREEVRPQPADGLGKPPWSMVEPVVERARVAAQSQTPPHVPSSQRGVTGSTPARSSAMVDDQGWQQSQRRGRTSLGSSRGQQAEGMGRGGTRLVQEYI